MTEPTPNTKRRTWTAPDPSSSKRRMLKPIRELSPPLTSLATGANLSNHLSSLQCHTDGYDTTLLPLNQTGCTAQNRKYCEFHTSLHYLPKDSLTHRHFDFAVIFWPTLQKRFITGPYLSVTPLCLVYPSFPTPLGVDKVVETWWGWQLFASVCLMFHSNFLKQTAVFFWT